MNLRLALYALADRYGLDAYGMRTLEGIAGLHDEPASLQQWIMRGAAVLAAALGGFGIILWIAANWDSLGRGERFALLQGFVLVMCAGAAWRQSLRIPLGLLALLAIGGLLAFFGQTYQTGADPWQLFALWAGLSLPLCLAARSDVVWTPWVVVTMSAISLWMHAHAGYRWHLDRDSIATHLCGLAAASLLALAMSRLAHRFTGAGIWALRSAATLTVGMTTCAAVFAIFVHEIPPHYFFALLVLVGAGALFSRRSFFDVYVFSVVALALDTVLVCSLARLLFENHSTHDPFGALLLLAAAAAGLLAVSVTLTLRLARSHGETTQEHAA